MRPCVPIVIAIAAACSSSPQPTARPAGTDTPSPVVHDAAVPDANPNERRIVWANIESTPNCFFFAGPFAYGTEDSYKGTVLLLRTGQVLELRLGDAVFRGLESVEGYTLSRKTIYEQDENPSNKKKWETTETISGDFDSRQATFRGKYEYQECEIGTSECPGRCTLEADLVVR